MSNFNDRITWKPGDIRQLGPGEHPPALGSFTHPVTDKMRLDLLAFTISGIVAFAAATVLAAYFMTGG